MSQSHRRERACICVRGAHCSLSSARYDERVAYDVIARSIAVALSLAGSALALGCYYGCAKARELSRCTSVDGAHEAFLVEPAGQWQDQFVHVRVVDRSGAPVVTREIGFDSGTVDALAWSKDGKLALTSGVEFVPRVWIDVGARTVGEQREYGEAAPPKDTWVKTCRSSSK